MSLSNGSKFDVIDKAKQNLTKNIRVLVKTFVVISIASFSVVSFAQLSQDENNTAGWGMQIYNVDPSTYPYVNVYIRTLDGNQNPLRNITVANVGVLVKGRAYDPFKGQYSVSTVRQLGIPVRTVFVIDSNVSMKGAPYEEALKASVRFIAEKSENDQVAIVETQDTKLGYSVVSGFSSSADLLISRLQDLRAANRKTRLYDAIGASLQLCRSAASEGSSSDSVASVASCSLVVFSNGRDFGSALRRSDLISSINRLNIPIPVHTLGYTKDDPQTLRNLQAISEVTFGKYFDASEAVGDIQSVVSNLQRVGRDDIVVTFRSTVEPDGDEYPFKIGIQYPANSGSVTYGSGKFEAIYPLPFKKIRDAITELDKRTPSRYYDNPFQEYDGDRDKVDNAKDKGKDVDDAEEKEDKSLWQRLFGS